MTLLEKVIAALPEEIKEVRFDSDFGYNAYRQEAIKVLTPLLKDMVNIEEVVKLINLQKRVRDNPKNHPLVSYSDVCEEIIELLKSLTH